MKSLCLIPARGGSKRLPNKNIRLIGEKPLIWYSIAFARFNKMDKIVVSTDNEEIAKVAKQCGAEVIQRPVELADDNSPTSEVARHALTVVTKAGFVPEIFVTLQPTNPLRPKTLYSNAIEVYKKNECDSVISVTKNKHKLGILDKNGVYNAQNYKPGTRSQDLSATYYENGLIYLAKPESIADASFFGNKIQTIETHELYSISDIDYELDLQITEFLLEKYKHLFSYLDS